jgi:hypothetical protein
VNQLCPAALSSQDSFSFTRSNRDGALIGTLLATPAGPAALAGGAKMLARNFPLVVLLVLIGMLFWPNEPTEEAVDRNGADLRGGKPNGAHPTSAGGPHLEAA